MGISLSIRVAQRVFGWVSVGLRGCFDGYRCGSKSVCYAGYSCGSKSVSLGIGVAQRVFHWILVWLKECFTGYSCGSECLAGLSFGSKSMFRLVFVWFKVYISLGIRVARSVCFA